MRWNMFTTPQEVIDFHYGLLRNPRTPVVVEYGWMVEGTVAYELSTNQDRTSWGVTTVAYHYRGELKAPRTWLVQADTQGFRLREHAKQFIEQRRGIPVL